jgi:hypothetical protein
MVHRIAKHFLIMSCMYGLHALVESLSEPAVQPEDLRATFDRRPYALGAAAHLRRTHFGHRRGPL